tara:strand:- start:487 stop:672 length:186 start_codon:yes stop_codon:yes gene_type:complete
MGRRIRGDDGLLMDRSDAGAPGVRGTPVLTPVVVSKASVPSPSHKPFGRLVVRNENEGWGE